MAYAEKLTRPLQIGPVRLRNRVFLAPMSGISDLPMRQRAWSHGAGMVVSEMVASRELVTGRAETGFRLRRDDIPVHVVQLAGRETQWMAEATRIACGEGADIVDINMGCPARKVTGGYSGSALMRDLDHALRLIEATVAAASTPVTLKMRLGWDETSLNAPELALRAEQAGVAMVTVHGRTRCQLYEGHADWRAIARVREAISIPLVANGDAASLDDAARMLELSGADAVMIGRAHCGRPWLAGSIAAEAGGAVAPHVPAGARQAADYVVAHYEDMLSFYGADVGVRQARKHLGWYLDRLAPALSPHARRQVLTAREPAAVVRLIRQAICRTDEDVALPQVA